MGFYRKDLDALLGKDVVATRYILKLGHVEMDRKTKESIDVLSIPERVVVMKRAHETLCEMLKQGNYSREVRKHIGDLEDVFAFFIRGFEKEILLKNL